MADPQDIRTTLEQFVQNVGKWREEASKLHLRTESPRRASNVLLLQVEETSSKLYREIESFDATVAEVAKQSPLAAGELAEVGETLRLLLLDITELGTELYSTRSRSSAPTTEQLDRLKPPGHFVG